MEQDRHYQNWVILTILHATWYGFCDKKIIIIKQVVKRHEKNNILGVTSIGEDITKNKHDELVKEMVQEDLQIIKRKAYLKSGGFEPKNNFEW